MGFPCQARLWLGYQSLVLEDRVGTTPRDATMRIMGFSKQWPKLSQNSFTTFRYPRGDKDWIVGEQVRIAVQPRRKGGGDKLGIAEIVNKEWREMDTAFHQIAKGRCAPLVTDVEAQEDGFNDLVDMIVWMHKTYGKLDWMPCMNKLTLQWVEMPL